jgi:hypothetical protein
MPGCRVARFSAKQVLNALGTERVKRIFVSAIKGHCCIFLRIGVLENGSNPLGGTLNILITLAAHHSRLTIK